MLSGHLLFQRLRRAKLCHHWLSLQEAVPTSCAGVQAVLIHSESLKSKLLLVSRAQLQVLWNNQHPIRLPKRMIVSVLH
ncbi:hypothetical protein OSTOST_16404 [Ostertagia ostertagi]